jgi:hypothetical protein
MQSDPEKLLKRHEKLIHSDMLTVVSHIQREEGDWLVNTLMIRGYDVPFSYKRKDKYKNLTGQRVNLTYYPDVRMVAGIEFEIMKVVRIRVA